MKQNKIRVLHFIPGFLYGGIESLFMMWFNHIDKDQYDFELLLRTKEQNIELLDQYKEIGGTYHRLAVFSPKRLFTYIKSVKNFFKEHHDYDILHAHGGDPLVFYYAKKYGVKSIIYHSHTTSEGKADYKVIKSILRRFYDTLITHRAACSTLAANWLFGVRDDVTLIFNSVNIHKFKFNPATRQKYQEELNVGDKKIIISVGRLTYQKNFPFIIDIFDEVQRIREDVELWIVGNGPDEDLIKEMIASKNLNDKVKLLGRRSDVPQLLHASDLFLMPSHYEGLPVSIVEAQAAGVPSILSSVITQQVKVTDLVSYISLNESPYNWAQAVSEKLDHHYDKDMCYNKIVSSNFNIDNSIKILESLYSNIKQ